MLVHVIPLSVVVPPNVLFQTGTEAPVVPATPVTSCKFEFESAITLSAMKAVEAAQESIGPKFIQFTVPSMVDDPNGKDQLGTTVGFVIPPTALNWMFPFTSNNVLFEPVVLLGCQK